MKLQLKDCAQGGIFQLEPDQQTVVTHTLAPNVFYFNNPLTGKINFGNGANVIGKDSPQVATKLAQYGNASVWQVEAGGRMRRARDRRRGEEEEEQSFHRLASPCGHTGGAEAPPALSGREVA